MRTNSASMSPAKYLQLKTDGGADDKTRTIFRTDGYMQE